MDSGFASSLASVFTAALGGALVILGGWIADRRKAKREEQENISHEKAVLAGAYVVTNFINTRLNDWQNMVQHSEALTSELLRLRTAQNYVSKLIERSPPGSDRLMVTLLDVGLRLDALMDVASEPPRRKRASDHVIFANMIGQYVAELCASLETLEVIVTGRLLFVTEEELSEFQHPEQDQSTPDASPTPHAPS